MNLILILPIILSFVAVAVFLPLWIKKAKNIGLIWGDMNKYRRPKNVAGSGGLIVVLAFVLGVLSYIAIKTFVLKTDATEVNIFALLTTVIIAASIGFVDDLFGWVHGGLSAKLRIFLVFIAAIPLMVINAGHSSISVPLMGTINIGILYPLVLIPIGIIGATTTFNFLAGFNGLEAGQGIIILSFLSVISYLTGSAWLALIGLFMVIGLIVFYVYNKFPAKVFPGDVMTYSVGALIACMAILGNFERIAIFVFIPYILEVVLKLRGKLKKQSFGIPDKNNNLKMPYEKVYGLTHLSIFILSQFSKEIKEEDVVRFIFVFQIFICFLAFLFFGGPIFD